MMFARQSGMQTSFTKKEETSSSSPKHLLGSGGGGFGGWRRRKSSLAEDSSVLVSKGHFPPEVFSPETTPVSVASHLSGYLLKENRRFKEQKRFFQVNNKFLFYSRSRRDDPCLIKACIDLTKTSTICLLVRGGHSNESHARRFAIQAETHDGGEVCFFLKAKTASAARRWVDELNKRKCFWLGGVQLPSSGNLLVEEGEDDEEGWKATVGTSEDEYSDEGFYSCQEEEDVVKPPPPPVVFIRQQQDKQHSYSSLEIAGENDDNDSSSLVLGDEEEEEEEEEEDFVFNFVGASDMITLPFSPWNARFWKRGKESTFANLRVRGPQYLSTKEKISASQQSSRPLFELLAVDMFETPRRIDHIASHESNRVFHMLKREAAGNGDAVPFLFIFHVQIPGPPFYSFVAYFVASHPDVIHLLGGNGKQHTTPPSNTLPKGTKQLLLTFFRRGSDEFCNHHFKLIPRIDEGPWFVKTGVPSRPALIGNKLTNSYFRHPRYFELDVNIGSSTLVTKITQLATTFCKLLTVDLGMVLEGKDKDTLPEYLLAFVKVKNPDLKKAVPWMAA